MVLSLNHRTQGHVWSMAEIKFTADAVKILQSILTRRIQKNSLAGSYAALEEILDNVGCAIYVTDQTTWIKYWCSEWRQSIAEGAKQFGEIPVLGWVAHGNLYVMMTLLIGAAEVVLRRWRTLVMHLPLLLLMGVMITAPANNFERHMLPVAFVFGFVVLTFWRESQRARRNADIR